MVSSSRKQRGAGCRVQKGSGCSCAGCTCSICKEQKGAGYTFDLCKSDGVGGATRVKYDDMSPPALSSMSKCDSALGAIDASGSCAGQLGGKRSKRVGKKSKRARKPRKSRKRSSSGKQKGGKFGCRQPKWNADCL